MKYLFEHWEAVTKEIKDKVIFLFLDYDGTLAPIAEAPDKAKISKGTKELLSQLSKNLRFKLAIISGRSLTDIKNSIGLKDIIYAGNHGLEIEGPDIKFTSQISPRLKSIIRVINDDLLAKLSGIKGAYIEDKGLTISVHYRLVSNGDLPLLQSIFTEITKPFIVRGKIKISSGKKVYEIKPPFQWDKGEVVLWLLARQQFLRGESTILPVYIGDDVTDEDAFKVLKNKGLTVFAGESSGSEAAYYLKNTEEVAEFLKRILGLNKE